MNQGEENCEGGDEVDAGHDQGQGEGDGRHEEGEGDHVEQQATKKSEQRYDADFCETYLTCVR